MTHETNDRIMPGDVVTLGLVTSCVVYGSADAHVRRGPVIIHKSSGTVGLVMARTPLLPVRPRARDVALVLWSNGVLGWSWTRALGAA